MVSPAHWGQSEEARWEVTPSGVFLSRGSGNVGIYMDPPIRCGVPEATSHTELIVSLPVVNLDTFNKGLGFLGLFKFFLPAPPPFLGGQLYFYLELNFIQRERELEAGRINWLRPNFVPLSSFAFDLFFLSFCSNFAMMGRTFCVFVLWY